MWFVSLKVEIIIVVAHTVKTKVEMSHQNWCVNLVAYNTWFLVVVAHEMVGIFMPKYGCQKHLNLVEIYHYIYNIN